MNTNIDEQKLHQLLESAVVDFGATFNAPLILLGDRLGLYKAMSDGQPVTATELAQRTGTVERYMRECLNAQAASNYVDYDKDTGRYRLSPEQAM
jgi:hypothetical protein